MKRLIEFGFLVCAAAFATAGEANDRSLPILEKAARLKSGQFVWEPRGDPSGPVLIVINLTTQRALLFRGGIPIAASTISTGSKKRETPIGEFTVLQKEVMHRSRTYDNAPMPYMQRLTWKGVAMHAGHLPGYPASHGCIRLPKDFAKLLYGVTQIGTPVIITDAEQQRKIAAYHRALDDVDRELAEKGAIAQRELADSAKAKVAYEKAVRQHNAAMAKYRRKVSTE